MVSSRQAVVTSMILVFETNNGLMEVRELVEKPSRWGVAKRTARLVRRG